MLIPMNFLILKLLILYFFIVFVSSISSAPSSISLFPSPQKNITISGDAYFLNTSIILTRSFNCTTTTSAYPPLSGVGRAFLADPIRFLDSLTKTASSFSCKFSFTITSYPYCSFGDGLAFLITSSTDSFGLADGYMGLPEIDSEDRDGSFLAVEFDTNFDPYYNDINDNHIGVDVDTISSLAAVDAVSGDVDLKNGRELTVWIEYGDSERLIRVWVGYNSQVKPSSPVLETKIDLSVKFKEFMHVGFSAANGKGSATHSVNQWSFKTFNSLSSSKTPMTMEVDSEIDCLICKPEETSNLKHSSSSRHFSVRLLIIVVVVGGSGLITSVVVLVVFVWLGRRRKRWSVKDEGQMLGYQGNRVMKRMSLSEIKEATNGFSPNRIIGEGGSAVVYDGQIPSCGPVAVKRFCQESKFGPSLTSTPFNTEFATMVGCLRHKNLVQLQGWCCEKNELVLVYEFMANGSLDKILHRRTYFTKYLTWEKRLHIVLGVASALIYLHEECESQIIHRDVKTCNIMLDEKFNAKLGDFGLAEVYGHDCRSREATVPAGTMGYLAPEYAFSGVPTVKTDVYSFGIVVLEVVSGRRPVDEDGTVITAWVWTLWETGNLIGAVDNKLMGRFDRAKMERILRVGLFCAHPDHHKRPTMRAAARMLRGEAPLPVFPRRKPIVRIQSVLPESCEEIMRSDLDLDETPWCTPRSHFSKD